MTFINMIFSREFSVLLIFYMFQEFRRISYHSDLRWPQPAMTWSGAWVPSWGLKLGSGGWKYQIVATRPVVSDKRPGLQLRRTEFPQRKRVVRQVKYLRWEKSTVCVDRPMGRLRERDSESPSHAPKAVWIIYGIFLPGFLWTVI